MSTQADVLSGSDGLSARVDSLAAWVSDLEGQLRATAVTGDTKALKELAKALDAWSKHDPKLEERITNRVDVLADRFATLSGTVNTTANALAGKDGEIAQLRRELEAGNARIESLVRDLRQSSGSGADVAELRKAIATLSSDRRSGSGEGRVDAVAADVDVLAQRLDTLSKTVSTTAASLAGKEGELVSLRARLELGDARTESLVAELRSTVAQLSHRTSNAGDSPRDPEAVRAFETHLLDLSSRVEQLSAGLESVSTTVQTTTAGVATNESELQDVQRRLEEAGARVEALVAEVRQVGASLPTDDVHVDPAFEDKLAGLATQVDELGAGLTELGEEAAERSREAATASLELERLVDAVTHRLGEVERVHTVAASELERLGGAWNEERAWVREQLDQLAAAVADARRDDGVAPRLEELAARIEATEHGQHAVGVELTKIAAAWDAERQELKRELESFASSLAESATDRPVAMDEQAAELFVEVVGKLEALEREGVAVAAEISRVESTWSGELGTLAARLDEVAHAAASPSPAGDTQADARIEEVLRRLESIELEIASSPAGGAAGDPDELRDIRVLINGLRMRLASSEKELAALSGSGDVVPRLDDLSIRLALLERTAAAAPQYAPVPGDGRFRVEVRGLELRMQELELAARENRDAVLTQFEKLASRLQWRLQQLETLPPEYAPAAPGAALGQVVPIRSEV